MLSGVITDGGRALKGGDGVSLFVPAGQSIALVSDPVSISTQLLDAIAGLRRPRFGQVNVGDLAVHRLSGRALERYRAGRGLLSARFPLLASLSAIDNVLGAQLAGRVDAAARMRAAKLLASVGVGHLTARAVGAPPADEQWRIMVARALLPEPRLVLAEDPALSLDARGATVVMDLLVDAQERSGFTLLVATSRLLTASRVQRMVRITPGAVAEDELTVSDDAWTRGRIDRIG